MTWALLSIAVLLSLVLAELLRLRALHRHVRTTIARAGDTHGWDERRRAREHLELKRRLGLRARLRRRR